MTVDLNCAVRLSVLPMRKLPCRGTVLAMDSRPRDRAGRVRTKCTLPGHRRGVPPGNAGRTYPASPPTSREVLALLDCCPRRAPYGVRDRALIVVLWRSGMRINEALSLMPHNLDPDQGTLNIESGKGGKQRFAAMDPWGWEQIEPWLRMRKRYPIGPVFCVVEGATRGGRMSAPYVRTKLKQLAREAGIEKRIAPHQLRHAHAVELAREIPMHLLQRQLGHSSLATTANYLAGIAPVETWNAIAARPAPVTEVTA